jgi:nucleotide-binding universal stress UspA family protein
MIPKIILAASDLSEKSALVIERAALLARHNGAHLELLHVVEDRPQKEVPAPLQDLVAASPLQQLKDAAREKLEGQSEQSVGKEICYTCRVENGKDFVVIIRSARQLGAALIVIGAHGSHSLRDFFLGTTAEKVVRKGGLPVLVVKNRTVTPYRRLLVPTDFSDAARQALLTALTLAPEAHLDLLHVYEFWGEGRLSLADSSKELREQYHRTVREGAEIEMTEWLRGIDLGRRPVERHFRHGHPGSLIPQLAKELTSDLVAMGTAGRSGLPYILVGSVAEHALREAPCDVLMVRPATFRFELP